MADAADSSSSAAAAAESTTDSEGIQELGKQVDQMSVEGEAAETAGVGGGIFTFADGGGGGLHVPGSTLPRQ